jgi:hypothetical protein
MFRTLSVLVGALLLAGCSAPDATLPVDEAAPAVPVVVTAAPTHLSIPAIGVDVDLDPLGLNPDGSMATPPVTEPSRAGWFEPGVKPGDPGPAVVAGHVSGRPAGATASVPGVFARLGELHPGDSIEIARDDGTTTVWRVSAVDTYPKDAFPTAAIFGDTPGPALRLITCGGIYDPAVHHYDSNVVASADLVDLR